jgi:D-alanyl-D-alanine carboxypeptidase/D-alanyl-D-alanine-endopeptidase (penicillin-binding protein 4)
MDAGVLNGDLLVVGGGDPSISARFNDESPTAVFEDWADALRERGIERITGRVVADDDRFEDVHIGPGWSWDYLDASYAAEIGALLLNDGALGLRFLPGDSVGDSASVTLDPPTSYVTFDGVVRTVEDTTDVDLSYSRDPFSNVVRLTGDISIQEDTLRRTVAVHDPTMYFATVLTETLRENGIEIAGDPVDRDDEPLLQCDSAVTVLQHLSPPVSEMIVPFLKVSQNQMGEMFMRYLGAAATDTGSVETGRRVVESQLTSWGISPRGYVYFDGSGLSRYNYLSPDTIVRLLRVMAQREDFDVFYDALPIAGEDGTLRNRFAGTRAERNARAKTGFISNARALSGYVTTRDGERLAFSLITNDFDVPVRVVEYAQDLVVELLANYSEAIEDR